jgi:hypothetical protein
MLRVTYKPFMLSVIMLNVAMLSVITLSVVAPIVGLPYISKHLSGWGTAGIYGPFFQYPGINSECKGRMRQNNCRYFEDI